MSDPVDPHQSSDSSNSEVDSSLKGGRTQQIHEISALIARNSRDLENLKSKLTALGERKEDSQQPAPEVEMQNPAPANAPFLVTKPPLPKKANIAEGTPGHQPQTHLAESSTPQPMAAANAPGMAAVEGTHDISIPAIAADSPVDTRERLKTPHKQGLWSKIGGGSLMFAALFHLILLIIGAFWIFQIISEPEKKVDFMPPGGGGGERSAKDVAVKKLKQITPTTNVKRVFAEGATASYAIPEQGDNFGEMSTLSSLSGGGMSGGLGGSGSGDGFGKGNGKGGGMGIGAGVGKLFGLIPESMRKRCSKDDRLLRLKENGGTPACEDAVLKSLRWLKSIQNADGSWGQDSPADLTGKASMTGFALLAYFGHCETPVSDEFGESCMKGIVYLVGLGMKNDGKMTTNLAEGHWPYEHAVATYALGEASTFCQQLKIEIPDLMEITRKTGQFIIDNQNDNGGWAYSFVKKGGHADTSITGWQLQALKACSHNPSIRFAGLIPCVRKGLRYMGSCQNPSGGFGYAGLAGVHPGYLTLTGVCTLCNQMWGKGRELDAKKGVEYIKQNTKFDYATGDSNLYQHYYESQAMMYSGGEDWKHYNNLFRDQILNNQDPEGSWKAPGSGNDAYLYGKPSINGKIYRSCLCTLMLEVYYRFLSTGGDTPPGI